MTEKALEAFFSTVQSNAVHVTWGAPPAAAERTRDWALLQFLLTQPESAGRAHIYLHNLGTGMDANGAIRSMGEDVQKFNAWMWIVIMRLVCFRLFRRRIAH